MDIHYASFVPYVYNVLRMKILGAKVVPVTHGLKTLKEEVDSALEAYLKDPINTIYCIGSVVGPHPFPMMVRDFQRVVGIEAKDQFFEMTGELPDNVVACVGGGSNAIGIFSAFLNDEEYLKTIERYAVLCSRIHCIFTPFYIFNFSKILKCRIKLPIFDNQSIMYRVRNTMEPGQTCGPVGSYCMHSLLVLFHLMMTISDNFLKRYFLNFTSTINVTQINLLE